MRKNDQKAEPLPSDSDSCCTFAVGRRLLYALTAQLCRFAAGMRLPVLLKGEKKKEQEKKQ